MNTEGVIASVVEASSQELGSKAMGIMVDMFGADTLNMVQDLQREALQIVSSVEEANELLVSGGIGAVAGALVGVLITRTIDELNRRHTGQDPVPKLGTGCVIVPKTMFIFSVGGLVYKIVAMSHGGN